jgi:hypothetical protein
LEEPIPRQTPALWFDLVRELRRALFLCDH